MSPAADITVASENGTLVTVKANHGLADRQRQHRATVLAAAYAAHPDRFVRQRPVPPVLPTAAWINPPKLLGPAADDRSVNSVPLVSQTR